MNQQNTNNTARKESGRKEAGQSKVNL